MRPINRRLARNISGLDSMTNTRRDAFGPDVGDVAAAVINDGLSRKSMTALITRNNGASCNLFMIPAGFIERRLRSRKMHSPCDVYFYFYIYLLLTYSSIVYSYVSIYYCIQIYICVC